MGPVREYPFKVGPGVCMVVPSVSVQTTSKKVGLFPEVKEKSIASISSPLQSAFEPIWFCVSGVSTLITN